MQFGRYGKGCKRDEVEEDRTVGAEGISISSARGAGMTVVANWHKWTMASL